MLNQKLNQMLMFFGIFWNHPLGVNFQPAFQEDWAAVQASGSRDEKKGDAEETMKEEPWPWVCLR